MPNDTIQVSIDEGVFRRMQAQSVPLVDTVSSVIERLLDFHDANNREEAADANENGSSSVESVYHTPASPPDPNPTGPDDIDVESRLAVVQRLMEQPDDRHGPGNGESVRATDSRDHQQGVSEDIPDYSLEEHTSSSAEPSQPAVEALPATEGEVGAAGER